MQNTDVVYERYELTPVRLTDRHFVVVTDGEDDDLYIQACGFDATYAAAIEEVSDFLSQKYSLKHLTYDELQDEEGWQDDFDEDAASGGLWQLVGEGEYTYFAEQPDASQIVEAFARTENMTVHTLETDDAVELLEWLVDNFDRKYKNAGETEWQDTLEQCTLVGKVE